MTKYKFAEYYNINSSGCWIWNKCLVCGYGCIGVDGKNKRAHRIAWQLYRGPIPEGLFVLHKCDVPSCVNPEHLFVGTQADNMLDKKRKGRCADRKGSKHPRAKLTEDDVLAIRSSTEDFLVIAKKFGIAFNTVRTIKYRTSWKHVI